MYKKYIMVFLCLLIVGNIAYWNVLCFGADGHIELESAFEKCCDDPDYCAAPNQNGLSYKTDHETCKHCGPCLDIPILNNLVQISNTPPKIITKFPASKTYMLIDIDKINSTVYNVASNTFNDTSYFDPLRTVVLLV
ncbi:MAG: hypothetical protein RQ760_05430 [Sedimentisphaerales bacterium]|nr:hypothetical protein [Sedimentisphaerales bacterium]